MLDTLRVTIPFMKNCQFDKLTLIYIFCAILEKAALIDFEIFPIWYNFNIGNDSLNYMNIKFSIIL